jgi:hypothetical protein
MKFDLFEKSGSGTVIRQSYKGCWIICDNGYLKCISNGQPQSLLWECQPTDLQLGGANGWSV